MLSPTRSRNQLATRFASQWLQKRNRLMSAETTSPTSSRLAWWSCTRCDTEFSRRVRDHILVHEGNCPSCDSKEADDLAKQHGVEAYRKLATSKKGKYTPTQTSSLMLEGDDRLMNPMLAYPWQDHEADIGAKEKLIISPKLDGIRCIALFSERHDIPLFLSRNGTVFESCDRIADALLPAFRRDPKLVLDGELYNHDLRDFNRLIGGVRAHRNRCTAEHREVQSMLQFHAFDMLYSCAFDRRTGGDVPFPERAAILAAYHADRLSAKAQNVVALVPQTVLASKAGIEDALDATLADGFEGIMIRRTHKDTGYAYGRRTKDLLKYKRFADKEFEIVGVEEGKGRLTGAIGSVICQLPRDPTSRKPPVRFNVTIQAGDEVKRAMWEKKQGRGLKGQMLTVTFQELTAKGIPRFPIGKCIRGNKDPATWV